MSHQHIHPTFLLRLATFLFLVVALCPARAQWTPNSQEQQIASQLNGSGQRRPRLVYDPIIARVAREKAQDMANRGYFDHVSPSGLAANILLSRAGYQLPAWWGDDPKANYVESIAAGLTSASSAWDGWMNSPLHKKHLLGLDPFYAEQTHYGVGFVSDPGSPYRYYWVVITAPPQPAADLVVTAPANGATLVDPFANVTGTAAADSGVQSVEVRIENANGATAFVPASGTTNWRAAVSNLAPGQNTIRVRSRTAAGGVIAELTRAVKYVVTSNLTVAVGGGGSVTAGFAGTTRRQIGSGQTIIATPARGYLFAGWTGDVTGAGRALTFTMGENMTVRANFVVDVFPSTQGTYQGLVESGPTHGMAQLALTSTGAFSGKLMLDGTAFPFTGNFDPNGTASVQVSRGATQSALTVNFGVDPQNLNGEITGSVTDGTFAATFSMDRAVIYGRRRSSPMAGAYTVRLVATSSETGDELPAGSGFATVNVSKSGSVTVAGRLVDDTLFSQGTTLSSANEMSLYVPLYGGSGAVIGSLTLSGGAVTGSLRWTQPSPNAAAMKFTLTATGSAYRTATRRRSAVRFPASALTLDGGNLAEAAIASPLVLPVTVTKRNEIVITEPNAQHIALSVSSANGVITGTILHPLTKTVRPIRGIVLQNQNTGYGYFLGADESGAFTLGTP